MSLTTLRPNGLMTDQNVLEAPVGAMRVADDVIFERAGAATIRPSFTFSAEKSSSQRPRGGVYYDSTLFFSSWDASTSWAIETTAATITGEAEPLNYLDTFVQFAEARKNLYYTTKIGPMKLTSGADTGAELAGMHEAPSGVPTVVTSGTPAALANNMAAAWRWCFYRVDANDLVMRSPPSPWQSYINTSGATVDMTWRIPLPVYAKASMQIELYRTASVASGATPSDQLFLAQRYVIQSADVTAGYADVTDRTAPADLAQELYTNATRDGFLKPNGRPPACQAIASWEDCVWYGYVRGPWTCAFDVRDVGSPVVGPGYDQGICYFEMTGDTTSGSPTLTSVTANGMDQVKVGQMLTGGLVARPGQAGSGIPADARVISFNVGAQTITLDKNATATAVAIDFRLHDGIAVDGVTYWADVGTGETVAGFPTFNAVPTATIVTGGLVVAVAREIAYSISLSSSSVFAYAVEDPYARDAEGTVTKATVVVRSVALDDAQWAVTFVADVTSSPPAISFEASPTGGALVARDEYPNGIAYSKPGEPEAVPELNFLTVGALELSVLALSPLPGGMLVWTKDAVYRVTGSAPDGWRVDLIAPGVRLIRGESVSVMGGVAYAWTDGGIVACDESGATSISAGRIDMAIRQYADRALVQRLTGAWVRTWPFMNLVLVGVPTATSGQSSDATYIFAFNTNTGAWARWTFAAWCAVDRPGFGSLYLARGGAYWETRVSQNTYGTFTGYDRAYSVNFTTTGTTLTITKADVPAYAPKAGDWASRDIGGVVSYRRFTAVADGGATWSITLASAFPTGVDPTARTVYESIVSKLQWLGMYSGGPGQTSRARALQPLFDLTGYTGTIGGTDFRVLLGAQTDVTAGTIETAERTETRAARLLAMRGTLPRNAARFTHVMPYVETCDIGIDWRCLGMVVDLESVGERTER